MLLDWVTLHLDFASCPDWFGWRVGREWGHRIVRYDPRSGDVIWHTTAWDTVRSDTHQVVVRFTGNSLTVGGSPARCMGDSDAVFGVGPDGRDLYACSVAMLAHVARVLCIHPFPSPRLFRVTRVDVTSNFVLPSLPAVRVALSELRNVEGGRYRVSQQAGDTVYWSHRSTLKSGKAYAKGPHLRFLMSKAHPGRQYTEEELSQADRLLRLELRLGSEFWRRNPKRWYAVTWDDLYMVYQSYFSRMLGTDEAILVKGVDMGFLDRCIKVADTPGQGKAAARTWAVIQSCGWQAAKESMPERSWYRHLSILKAAGLGDADVSAGRVVSLRRPLILHPVASWEDLRRAA